MNHKLYGLKALRNHLFLYNHDALVDFALNLGDDAFAAAFDAAYNNSLDAGMREVTMMAASL